MNTMRSLFISLTIWAVLYHVEAMAQSDRNNYGGDPAGRHYSSLTQINSGNVDQLEVAWIYSSGDMERYGDAMKKTSAQSTPLLLPPDAGELLVYCNPFGDVIALSPASGEEEWVFRRPVNTSEERTWRCRGVSYAGVSGSNCPHRIFIANHDRQLWGLNAETGKPCEDFGENGVVDLYGAQRRFGTQVGQSSSPLIAGDMVIVGSQIEDFANAKTPRGIVSAFNVISGEKVWSFDPLKEHSNSGSANVWAPMSVDMRNRLVYLPTSSPSPDYYGVHRPGNNDYANSIVALNIDDGTVRWSFQHSRHDLWDFDTPAQPVLFEWKKDGESIPALAQVTKQGFVFILNRITGESLWEITEQPVPPSAIPGEITAPTQPKPIAPPPLVDPYLIPKQAWGLTPIDRAHCRSQLEELNSLGLFTPLSEEETLMFPGSLGGANWGGGALIPEEGRLIVNVNNVPFTGRFIKQTPAMQATGRDHPKAGERMRVNMQGTPYAIEIGALQSFFGIPCNPPPWGKLISVNMVKGTIDWEVPLGSVHELGPVAAPFHIEWGTPNLGGGLMTDGGVFFIGATMDRQFRAFDSKTATQTNCAQH